jgi:hypothetical protein
MVLLTYLKSAKCHGGKIGINKKMRGKRVIRKVWGKIRV